MPNAPLAQRLLQVLKEIDEGTVTVTPENCEWHAVYAGNVVFVAANGWRITVFNDCDSWDYIDNAVSPEGETIDFDEIFDHHAELAAWEPTNLKAWGIHG